MDGSVRSLDGTTIRWRSGGHGPPAVLVHGSCADRSSWTMSFPLLAERMAVNAIDRRGRGLSTDGGPYSIDREFEDVVAVIEAVGREVVLIGHSYGAIVSLGAACLTDRVARVIAYEPPLLANDFGDCDRWAGQIESTLAAGDRDSAAEAFLASALTEHELGSLRAIPSAWEQVVRDVHTVPRELREIPVAAAKRFDAVNVPVLLLLADSSQPVYSASVERLAAELPAATVERLEEQGHMTQTFAPELFCSKVFPFLDTTV